MISVSVTGIFARSMCISGDISDRVWGTFHYHVYHGNRKFNIDTEIVTLGSRLVPYATLANESVMLKTAKGLPLTPHGVNWLFDRFMYHFDQGLEEEELWLAFANDTGFVIVDSEWKRGTLTYIIGEDNE